MLTWILHFSLTNREDVHTECRNLSAQIDENWGNMYRVLSCTSRFISNDAFYQDSRLQNNLYWIWTNFTPLFAQGLEKEPLEGTSYIVRQALEFEVVCTAGDSSFSCRYTGPSLDDFPGDPYYP